MLVASCANRSEVQVQICLCNSCWHNPKSNDGRELKSRSILLEVLRQNSKAWVSAGLGRVSLEALKQAPVKRHTHTHKTTRLASFGLPAIGDCYDNNRWQLQLETRCWLMVSCCHLPHAPLVRASHPSKRTEGHKALFRKPGRKHAKSLARTHPIICSEAAQTSPFPRGQLRAAALAPRRSLFFPSWAASFRAPPQLRNTNLRARLWGSVERPWNKDFKTWISGPDCDSAQRPWNGAPNSWPWVSRIPVPCNQSGEALFQALVPKPQACGIFPLQTWHLSPLILPGEIEITFKHQTEPFMDFGGFALGAFCQKRKQPGKGHEWKWNIRKGTVSYILLRKYNELVASVEFSSNSCKAALEVRVLVWNP